MKKYQPQQFESKWVDFWDTHKTYKTADATSKKGKKYILDMFPYPSGAGLHVGHPRGYTATDILSRFYRMNGFSVLHPMGWDAFGLPAENAAIKAKKNPLDMVPDNIVNFKKQMKMLGFSYDWDREFATTDPTYYKWTQWLFIQFYKMGLLYKKNTPINFCPFCKTGLAEEEVLANGTHERCGNTITKKDLPQWIFRITTYADRLTDDLKLLQWPTGILEMQKNWIGKKQGLDIEYPVEGTNEIIHCFTTRPETNFGATFIVLAPEHELVQKMLDSNSSMAVNPATLQKIREYYEKTKSKSEVERMTEGRQKTGVFTGLYGLNRLNHKLLPIYVSDFVLAGFGTGAVVGVPAHDSRDFEFAKAMGIEIIRVVKDLHSNESAIQQIEQVYEEAGEMINSDFLNGLDTTTAAQKIIDHLVDKGWAKKRITYHLRDWIFSRQRYWGEPIPMVFCQKCADEKISYWDREDSKHELKNDQKFDTLITDVKDSMVGWFPLSNQQLPLELPYVQSYEPTDTGESPLSRIPEFMETVCPHCQSPATRESDTMPNWAGSCWYFLRFVDPKNDQAAWDIEKLNEYMPVDWYVGGAEHAVLHLLYARFWQKALQDLGLVKQAEPFIRLRNVGMILAEDHRKMSKSWGNVINPDEVVEEFGADTLRTYEMFMAPFSQEIPWSKNALHGVYRFLTRIWNIYQRDEAFCEPAQVDQGVIVKLNKTIVKVSQDIEEIKLNTAVAAMMEFLNVWEGRVNKGETGLSKTLAKDFLKLLCPWAPFITEELWHEVFGQSDSIHLSDWPNTTHVDAQTATIQIPIQVNGKVRAVITFPSLNVSEQEVVQKALIEPKIRNHIGNTDYKVIYVPNKTLNFIVQK